jgi:HD-GYP domain-containing protein (c-di-GMP phosphodiesterase class II)
MSKRKHLTCLIVAQLICLGLGLWIQQNLVLSATRRIVEAGTGPEQVLPAMVSTLKTASVITFVWCSTLLGIVGYLVVTRVHERFAQLSGRPEVEELKRTATLVRTQEAIIFGLAKLADSRDADTGDHLERIALYSSTLASALRRREEFRDVVTPAFVQSIGLSSALHDIGKVGVEDAVLRKPGALTPDERTRIQEHAGIGELCLQGIERRLGRSNFLQMAREIAAAHHERWDGRGYPRGLSGEQIPLAARIVAVADVYDALSSKRVYKPSLPHDHCVEIIRSEAGGQFDPRLVEVFLDIEGVFRGYGERFDVARATAAVQCPADSSVSSSLPVRSGAAV